MTFNFSVLKNVLTQVFFLAVLFLRTYSLNRNNVFSKHGAILLIAGVFMFSAYRSVSQKGLMIRKCFWPLAWWLFALIILMSVSSVCNASDVDAASLWGLFNRIIIQLTIFFFAIIWISSKDSFPVFDASKHIAYLFVILGLIASVVAIQFILTGRALFGFLAIEHLRWPQLYGWFASPNYMVDVISVSVLSAFFLYSSTSLGKHSRFALFSFAFLFLILLFTGSRGGILSFFVAFLFQYYISRYTSRHERIWAKSLRKKFLWAGMVLVGLSLILVFYFAAQEISFSSLKSNIWRRGLGSIESEPRLFIWLHAIKVFSSRTVFQVLFGSGNDMFLQEEGMSTHNSYLVILLDYGLINFMMFLAFMFWVTFLSIQLVKKNRKNPSIGRVIAFFSATISYNFLRAIFQGGILLGGAIGWLLTIMGLCFFLFIKNEQKLHTNPGVPCD